MLFVYPEEVLLECDTRGIQEPLSVAFLNKQGVVVELVDLPEAGAQLRSTKPAAFALEVPRGWFADHNVTVGTSAELEGFY